MQWQARLQCSTGSTHQRYEAQSTNNVCPVTQCRRQHACQVDCRQDIYTGPRTAAPRQLQVSNGAVAFLVICRTSTTQHADIY